MWAVSAIPTTPFLSKPNRPCFRPVLPRNLARSLPPQNDDDYGEDIGGLGHTILINLSSTSNPLPKRLKQKQGEGKQLSGSDVLWALQKAAAKKKTKNKKRRELSSADGHRGERDDDEDVVDYSNVKPLCIKSEWAVKLDELETRLQELSDIN
ncbi:hypothetical protein ACOSP7_000750 [Xanthoceras sorbifolium]|uniref:Uncharacterized protein n=1 Tax=Xanthoceras sorbifolium TaxID=99658 RepID=A0ABQ8IN21_9ROSI|nr:hypothetical protein JRO89_XS01G0341300 [Xanthoceras sorbifolium]